LPSIALDQAYYRVVADFEARFPGEVPDLMQCESLTIQGDITFAASVSCQGDVTLMAPAACTITESAVFANGCHTISAK